MDHQCNSCGGFKDLLPCSHCMTMLCEGCQRNHESFCAKLAQLKARGAGFTVAGVPQGEHRHGHEIPPPTPPDRPREEPVPTVESIILEPEGIYPPETPITLPAPIHFAPEGMAKYMGLIEEFLESPGIVEALAEKALEPVWVEKPGEITDDSFNSFTWVNAGPALPADEVLESSADLGLQGIAPEPLDEGPRTFIIGKADSE